MGEHGWPFAKIDKFADADVDPLYDSEHVKDLYLKADPDYTGRFVPTYQTFPHTFRRTRVIDSQTPTDLLFLCSGTRRTIQL